MKINEVLAISFTDNSGFISKINFFPPFFSQSLNYSRYKFNRNEEKINVLFYKFDVILIGTNRIYPY